MIPNPLEKNVRALVPFSQAPNTPNTVLGQSEPWNSVKKKNHQRETQEALNIAVKKKRGGHEGSPGL